jgi:hypothetical protein
MAEECTEVEGEAAVGILHALLALIIVQDAQFKELRRIRKCVCHAPHADNRTVSLNLTGKLVPKDGGVPVPVGPFNPAETDDVDFAIGPLNAAGSPTTGPFNWTSNDPAAGMLNVSADTKSAKLVTAAGPISTVVMVTDSVSGISDTATVSRVPADNATTSLNLVGTVVPK